jgi:hypothetical protein
VVICYSIHTRNTVNGTVFFGQVYVFVSAVQQNGVDSEFGFPKLGNGLPKIRKDGSAVA